MGCKPLTTFPKLCRGTPVLDYNLMASIEPEVTNSWYKDEKKIISPDHPCKKIPTPQHHNHRLHSPPCHPDAAACARNAIYFIDQRYDLQSALHIKSQLENIVAQENGHYYIDEIDATAERRDINNHTVFKWNPAYARVFFAESMNRRNPGLKLPVHEAAGDWLVVYDLRGVEIGGKAKRIGTGLNLRERDAVGLFLEKRDFEDGRDVDVASVRSEESLTMAIDTPRFDGEGDAEYYQRMDLLHWH